jgi:hypothetical protein
VDLAGRQVLEPCPRRVGEVQGEVAGDDLFTGGPSHRHILRHYKKDSVEIRLAFSSLISLYGFFSLWSLRKYGVLLVP